MSKYKLALLILAIVGLAVFHLATYAVAGDRSVQRNLEGRYGVSGVKLDGGTYEGFLEITELNPAMFRLAWEIEGGYGFVGKAALIGKTLSGAWGMDDKECFAVLYQVDSDGVLDGVWVSTGDDALEPWGERAVPTDKRHGNGVEGKYRISSSEGAEFCGTLDVSAVSSPNRFLFQWDTGRRFEGVGTLEDGEINVVASHAGEGKWCGGTVYEMQEDGQLVGKWWLSDPDSFSEQRSEIAVPH